MLIVYTAAIGETDTVRPPAVVDPDVRYLCFSDRPCPAPYEQIKVPTAADGTPPSRRLKVLADHSALREADALLWHDASYRLLTDLGWTHHVGRVIATMRHPRRRAIETEAVAVARYGYVTLARAKVLVAEYRAAGFPEVGLSSGGLIYRGLSTATFNVRWWAEVERWGYRDQASLDYAAWASGTPIARLAGTVRDNPYAAWREAA